MLDDKIISEFKYLTDRIRNNLHTRKCLPYLHLSIRNRLITVIKKLHEIENINDFLYKNLDPMFSHFLIKKQLLKYAVFLILYDPRIIKTALQFYYYSYFNVQFKKYIPKCNETKVLMTWHHMPSRSLFYNKFSYVDIIDHIINNVIEKMHLTEDNNKKYTIFVNGINTIKQSLKIFIRFYYKY